MPTTMVTSDKGMVNASGTMATGQCLEDMLPFGRVNELMCHPGYFNPAETVDTQLIGYHAWDAEYALLTGVECSNSAASTVFS